MELIIFLVILLFSVIIHEVMHGAVAEKFGDYTAHDTGRLTLNPIPHIDPFGSILVPALMYLSTQGAFVFGAAKPVPVNFENMRKPRLGMVVVSLAGPFSNLIIAFLLSLPITLGIIDQNLGDIIIKAVGLNLGLFVLNMLPIPPLDGSKVIAALLPYKAMDTVLRFEQYGFIILLLLLFSGALTSIILPVVVFFFRLFGLA